MFANTQQGGIDFAFSDTLLTPMPPLIPLPYTNVAQGSGAVNAASHVLIQGMPVHTMRTVIPISDGANAGVAGVSSGTVRAASRAVTGAESVLVDGSPVTRLTSLTTQNATNANGARIVPSQTKVLILAP